MYVHANNCFSLTGMQEHSPTARCDGLFALMRVESQQMPTGNNSQGNKLKAK